MPRWRLTQEEDARIQEIFQGKTMTDEKTIEPRGVIAIMTLPTGHVAATHADFERQGYGGFKLWNESTVTIEIIAAWLSLVLPIHQGREATLKDGLIRDGSYYKLDSIWVRNEADELVCIKGCQSS